MALNPDAVGQTGTPAKRSWKATDAMLYALGVGCGTDELQFATEKNQVVLPTFAVIVGMGGIPFDKLGSFNMAMMVHGEQAIELFDEIPPEGEVENTGRIKAMYDKGANAVVELECESVNTATGKPIMKNTMSMFIRGEGGWGGDRGSSEKLAYPDRKPDHEITYATREDQALLYRLNGDMNPLHSDPDFAKMAGFEKPILHGLCTYGFTGRALLHALCGDDPSRFKSMYGRFSKPVIPGDSLTISIWVDGNDAIYQTRTSDGTIVLDQGRCSFA